MNSTHLSHIARLTFFSSSSSTNLLSARHKLPPLHPRQEAPSTDSRGPDSTLLKQPRRSVNHSLSPRSNTHTASSGNLHAFNPFHSRAKLSLMSGKSNRHDTLKLLDLKAKSPTQISDKFDTKPAYSSFDRRPQKRDSALILPPIGKAPPLVVRLEESGERVGQAAEDSRPSTRRKQSQLRLTGQGFYRRYSGDVNSKLSPSFALLSLKPDDAGSPHAPHKFKEWQHASHGTIPTQTNMKVVDEIEEELRSMVSEEGLLSSAA